MDQLSVLIIGSGGREHALAWKVAQSPRVRNVVVAPGNAGTSTIGDGRISNIGIRVDDTGSLLQFARDNQIGLTVVGPEVPLAEGIVDTFTSAGLRIFGPTRGAARLEASKAYAKQFMVECHIPTAAYASFNDFDKASSWVSAFGRPVVVKADGLAAGKGVIMCDTVKDAIVALRRCMIEHEFGPDNSTVVVEERLSGREVSVLAFCDGRSVVTMPPARDHKRIFDNDEGPNTGGMGAYAPVPDVSGELVDEITHTVIQPAVDGMAARGSPYRGVLYAGIMLTSDGPRTLEFNCRFGDPETQVILPLLQSDLVDILLACIDGSLDAIRSDVRWFAGYCATVVASAPGYPGTYPKDLPINGLEQPIAASDAIVFHAGTREKDGHIVTSGGRVLSVSARGDTMQSALDCSYSTMNRIHFDGIHYRKDIGILH